MNKIGKVIVECEDRFGFSYSQTRTYVMTRFQLSDDKFREEYRKVR